MRATVFLVLFLLVGCSSPEPPAPAPSASPGPIETYTARPAPDWTPEPENEAAAAPAPDPAVVASMTCEPISAELLDSVRLDFGTPTRAIQVEVGEGLTPGETWWLAVLDSPADDAYEWGLRYFLTNAPGAAENGGTWLPISPSASDPWAAIKWDAERLDMAAAAMSRANDCLGV